MAHLRVDYRERKIAQRFQDEGEVEFVNLAVGDFMVMHGEIPVLILERKTLSDLASSMSDGRLNEQTCRLLAAAQGDARHVGFVIEGKIDWRDSNSDAFYGGITVGAVKTVLINMHISGFAVYMTSGPDETVALLRLIRSIVESRPDKFLSFTAPSSYVQNVKIKKSDNLDPRNLALIQLATIPQVSIRIAEVVLTHFAANSFGQLVMALHVLGPEMASKTISALKSSDRALGLRVSKAILASIF